jgi:archaellum component FlaF (FlaF/FlaG flagellin family)
MMPQQEPNDTPQITPEPPEIVDLPTGNASLDNDVFNAELSPDYSTIPAVDRNEPLEDHTTPIFPKKKSKKHLIIIAIVATLASALIGSGCAFAFWYNSPDKSVTDAFGQLLDISSMKAKGTLDVEPKDTDSPSANVNYNVSTVGSSVSSSIDGNITLDGKTINLKNDFILTDDSVSIKIKDFRNVLESILKMMSSGSTISLTPFDGLIKLIDNKWVVITKSDINDLLGNKKQDEKMTCAQNAIKDFRTSKSQQDEIIKLYDNNKYVVAKSLGTEIIEGKLNNHYEVSINNDKLKAFSKKLPETAVFKAIDKCYNGEISKSYNVGFLDKTSTGSTEKYEMWVTMFGHTLTKFKTTSDDTSTKTTSESTFEWNPSVQISAPNADTTFEELKAELLKIFSI